MQFICFHCIQVQEENKYHSYIFFVVCWRVEITLNLKRKKAHTVSLWEKNGKINYYVLPSALVEW